MAVVVFSLLIVPVTLWLGAGNVWVTVVSYVLLLALGVPYCMVIMDYMLGERRDFWCSLKRMKDGYQYWGAFFIILFCGGLIMGVLAAVSWLPAGILAYAGSCFPDGGVGRRCNGSAFIRSGFGRILLYVGFGDSERVQLAYAFPVVLPVWFG